jgi:hypothetical protein
MKTAPEQLWMAQRACAAVWRQRGKSGPSLADDAGHAITSGRRRRGLSRSRPGACRSSAACSVRWVGQVNELIPKAPSCTIQTICRGAAPCRSWCRRWCRWPEVGGCLLLLVAQGNARGRRSARGACRGPAGRGRERTRSRWQGDLVFWLLALIQSASAERACWLRHFGSPNL